MLDAIITFMYMPLSVLLIIIAFLLLAHVIGKVFSDKLGEDNPFLNFTKRIIDNIVTLGVVYLLFFTVIAFVSYNGYKVEDANATPRVESFQNKEWQQSRNSRIESMEIITPEVNNNAAQRERDFERFRLPRNE